jgi:hypothetical protein
VAWVDGRVESRMNSGDRAIYLLAVVDGRLERSAPILTSGGLFAVAPPDKRLIMDEQYEHDARLDAEAIRKWRGDRRD